MTRKPTDEPPHGRTTITQPGRKPFYCVNDKNGQPQQSDDPIEYLAWHKSTGRYYVSPSTPKVYLGRDLDVAIWRFRERASGTGRIPFTDQYIFPDSADETDTYAARLPVPEKQVYDYVRKLILDDPKLAAEKLRIPELARLASMPKPEPSLALAELFETYATHSPGRSGNGLAPKWLYYARGFWDEFCKLVPVSTVADVTVDHVIAYGDRVKAAGMSPTYTRHRFGLVKSVLSFAVTRGKDQSQLQRVLTACKVLTMPKANGNDPNPITVQAFAKLLEASDEKFKAIYLLSLNAALYPSEVAAVKKSHVNLSKRTLVMDRGKNGRPRIAVLWAETVKAIRALPVHGSEFVFVNDAGGPLTAATVTNNHRRIRGKSKVRFDHIRDGAETAAIEGGADVTHAKLLAGHAISGMTDKYVKRNPKMVADACEAIKGHYFGG